MTDESDHVRDDGRGSPRYQQNITAFPGSAVRIAQGIDPGPQSGFGLEWLRRLDRSVGGAVGLRLAEAGS